MARKKESVYETEQYPFPAQLRMLMKSTKTKQRELANAIGVRPQTVSLYVQGQSFPDVNGLTKIANFFNVSADYLLGRTKAPSRNENIQAVCNYTGLSAEAVKTIKDADGLISILNFLLEDPDINSLLFLIHDLAICECSNAYLRSQGTSIETNSEIKAVKASLFPYTDLEEKEDVCKYRLSVCFRDIFESIVQKIITQENLQNTVPEMLKHLTKDSSRGDNNGKH